MKDTESKEARVFSIKLFMVKSDESHLTPDS
jgi:hypothetical protein